MKNQPTTALTMNPVGLTIVPLEIDTSGNDVFIEALDPNYATPGPEEAQQF
ncbi:MAG: hypothetical protein AAF236_11975 [Verrucomicrobiota bacterium]